MKSGAEAGMPWRAQLGHVPEFVDQEQEDETHCEAPAPDPGIRPDRDDIDPAVTKIFSLKSARIAVLNLKMRRPNAAIGAQSFRPSPESRPRGWIGS